MILDGDIFIFYCSGVGARKVRLREIRMSHLVNTCSPSFLGVLCHGEISEGILCHPFVGGVVGWDVMTRGKDLMFSIAVYMRGAVVWEWGNASRALYRLRVWEIVMGVTGWGYRES